MPKLNVSIPETATNATRPIVFGIVRDLFKLTGIPTETMISYPGDVESSIQPGSGIDQKVGDNTLPYNNRVFIEVEENYELDRILSTAVFQPENVFIFRDDAIETYIKPVYSSADMSINFKYRAVDKTAAIRWRDNIRTRVAMNWDMRLHELDYHYLIPPEFLVILKELHRMREAVDGYGETYDQYFQNTIVKKATVLTNQSGSRGAWAIQERQIRIVGYFDFDTVPEQGSKEDEADTWTISFAYKFKYDKPISCVMAYPLMVHNQLVSQKYRPNPLVDKADPYLGMQANASMSASNFSYFEKNRNVVNIIEGIAIPSFDEFVPSAILDNTVRVFTQLINLDTVNPALLLSLRELGDTVIDPVILRFLSTEAQFLTKPGLSIFSLSLYRKHDLLENTAITVDSNLNVSSTYPLSFREYYHIRLGLAKDFSLLSAAAIERLRNNGDALTIILNALDGSLGIKGLLPTILGSNTTIVKATATPAEITQTATVPNGTNSTTVVTTIAPDGSKIITTTNIKFDALNGMITTVTIVTIAGTDKTVTTIKGAIKTVVHTTAGSNYIGRSDLQKALSAMTKVNTTSADKNRQRNTVATLLIQSSLLNK